MEKRAQNFLMKAFTFILASAMGVLSACSGFELDPVEQGTIHVRLTDAPADNPDIEAVYVTIVGVRVDGRVIPLDSTRTINVMALQNGTTELLATGELLAQAYKTVTLVLDFEKDEKGNAPGIYYLGQNGTKVGLAAGNQKQAGYSWVGSTRVYHDDTSTVVLDFDLRKFIKSMEGDVSTSFATNSELSSHLRFVADKKSGTITGNYIGEIEPGKQVVAYAYKRGTFNAYVEKKGKGGIQFLNSVASVSLTENASRSYNFPFLEEGEYELHFGSFAISNGGVVFEGLVNVTNEIEGEHLNTIKVFGGSQATVNVVANGLIN